MDPMRHAEELDFAAAEGEGPTGRGQRRALPTERIKAHRREIEKSNARRQRMADMQQRKQSSTHMQPATHGDLDCMVLAETNGGFATSPQTYISGAAFDMNSTARPGPGGSITEEQRRLFSSLILEQFSALAAAVGISPLGQQYTGPTSYSMALAPQQPSLRQHYQMAPSYPLPQPSMGNGRGPDLLTLNAPSHGTIEHINTCANKENIPPERLEAHASITSLSTDSELTMEAVSGSDDFPDDTASKAKSRCKNRDRSARDVSNEHKAILDVAYEHLRMLLITDKPWARGREMDRLIMQAWENACDELGLVGEQRLRPGLKERAQLVERGLQTRSAVKTYLQHNLFASHYGFKIGRPRLSEDDKARNCDQVKILLEQDAFVHMDARERGSVFQNPIVANAMHGLWFRDTQDTGVRLTHLYFVDGVPIETMALIFTVWLASQVRNCIDEFQRGSHKKIDFSERAYKSVYESLLGQLKRWSEYSRARSDRAGDFRREVLANCRVAAGVTAQEESAEEVIGGIPESELFACEDGD
ncbi:hypothetical protein CERSUDRAFT_97736 [Gelatoporia subvermispora B]|uniref:DUF6532 domain-containing protein n=1 Tax=Ceriporiopsis subvermispora (strain B) TaxID=914234 RepID=M2QQP0_CERS8|nr:hypothetical protein CERSUDRAFT_97736 [Gelatoporia subvermispora B]